MLLNFSKKNLWLIAALCLGSSYAIEDIKGIKDAYELYESEISNLASKDQIQKGYQNLHGFLGKRLRSLELEHRGVGNTVVTRNDIMDVFINDHSKLNDSQKEAQKELVDLLIFNLPTLMQAASALEDMKEDPLKTLESIFKEAPKVHHEHSGSEWREIMDIREKVGMGDLDDQFYEDTMYIRYLTNSKYNDIDTKHKTDWFIASVLNELIFLIEKKEREADPKFLKMFESLFKETFVEKDSSFKQKTRDDYIHNIITKESRSILSDLTQQMYANNFSDLKSRLAHLTNELPRHDLEKISKVILESNNPAHQKLRHEIESISDQIKDYYFNKLISKIFSHEK